MSKNVEITKETLERLYVAEDKTTYKIAKHFNCNRSVISRRLKKYGIDIKRHKRLYSLYYEQKLSVTQINLIIGSLLGDGCIHKHHKGINSCRFVEQHSIKQLQYLEWKKNILKNFVSNNIRIIDNSKNNSFGNGLGCIFETVLHKDFVSLYEMFYDGDVKHIPLLQLSPLGLAVWYFDDGSISKNNQKGRFYSVQFHTEGYDDCSINNLRTMLKEQFNINSSITKTCGYKLITLGYRDANKLMIIVQPYEIPCMAYKIQFSDNPVETQCANTGVSELKYSDANTHNSLSHSEMMV